MVSVLLRAQSRDVNATRQCGGYAPDILEGQSFVSKGFRPKKTAHQARGVETIFQKRGISIAGCAILGGQVRSGERRPDQHRCRWLLLVPCSTF
jgi:pseudouridine-5'-phosphate glycosidase